MADAEPRKTYADLDAIANRLRDGEDPGVALRDAVLALQRLRSNLGPVDWRALAQRIRHSELADRLREEPCTGHGFLKPYGYPGDSELIEMLSNGPALQRALAVASPLGTALARAMADLPDVRAVAWRAGAIAEHIDALPGPNPSICSIGCGRMLELHLSTRARDGRLGSVVAIDQDAGLETTLRTSHSSVRVDFHQANAVELVRRSKDWLVGHDLVYASGLFDYLPQPVAVRLLKRMADAARPDGKVLLVNARDGRILQAYTEAIMDWWLLDRTSDEMLALATAAGLGETAHIEVDPYGALVILTIRAGKAS